MSRSNGIFLNAQNFVRNHKKNPNPKRFIKFYTEQMEDIQKQGSGDWFEAEHIKEDLLKLKKYYERN